MSSSCELFGYSKGNKELFALATLAAVSGTAFAQSSVTLTGKLRFAYGTQTASNGGVLSGVGVTDGDLVATAVEDLGGGLKATATTAFVTRGRDTSITGRDASLSLAGGFGTVTIGAIEAGNGLLGLTTAGGPTYIGLDAGAHSATGMGTATVGVLAGASNTDILRYTTPVMNGFTASIGAFDTTTQGGAQSTAAKQDSQVLGFNYANGPLSAALDFTSASNNAASAPLLKSRTRISANYDLGVARIGGGNEQQKIVGGVERTDSVVSLSAPFGALVVGAVYGTTKTSNVAGNGKGTDMAVQYNLSKRTYVALQSRSTKQAGATASDKTTRVQLAHSF